MEEWRKRELEKREKVSLERKLRLEEKKHKLLLEKIEEDYQESRRLTKLKMTNRSKTESCNKIITPKKRYKITRKVFYETAYIEDDVIYVDDYMKDYVLACWTTLQNIMFDYYLHSIYDTKEGEFINAINL